MQIPVTIRSVSTVDFIAGIAQNAADTANLPIPQVSQGAPGGGGVFTVNSCVIQSVENLAWEIWLFGKNTFEEAAIDNEFFLGSWTFTALAGLRIGSAGFYHYFVSDLQIPYRDLDASGTTKANLHIALINRSASAKTAGAGGAIVVQIGGFMNLPG